MKTNVKAVSRARRHNRIRARVKGTAARPRLSVYRSNTALYAQLIDDDASTTLLAADTRNLTGSFGERAKALGGAIAEKAKAAGIEAVVFDRGGFRYAGNIAIFADSVREGGIKV